MNENGVRQIVAKNIIKYRKSFKLTQAELAEKLAYSDKAISKWERAESLPDVVVLNKIASFFEISLDELLSEQIERKIKIAGFRIKKITFVPVLSALITWVIATLLFVFFSWLDYETNHFMFGRHYLFFIYAVPITFIVLLVFSLLWWRRVLSIIMASILIWTLAMSIHVTCLVIKNAVGLSFNSALIYVICVPLEIMLILWFIFRGERKRHKN